MSLAVDDVDAFVDRVRDEAEAIALATLERVDADRIDPRAPATRVPEVEARFEMEKRLIRELHAAGVTLLAGGSRGPGRSGRSEPPYPAWPETEPSSATLPNCTSPVWAMNPSMTRWKTISS